MLHACLLLLAGMYVPQLSSFAIESDRSGLILVAACLLMLQRRLRPAAWLLAGLWLFSVEMLSVADDRLDPRYAGDSVVVTVSVPDFPRRKGESIFFPAEIHGDPRLPARLWLSWYQPPVRVHAGDQWRLEVRLRRPRAPSNPGGFDAEGWFARERIHAVGYVVESKRNHLLPGRAGGILLRLRQRFVDRVEALVGGTRRAGILNALVVGARHGISPRQWEQFARTGTSHLVAISGLHIGLAAAGGYLVTFTVFVLARARRNVHLAATAAGILLAVCYALVSGLGVPSRRAVLMLAVAGLGLVRRRRPDAARVLAATCIAISVADPLATMGPGFQLSFAAVALLLWFARRVRSMPARRGLPRVGHFVAALAGIQVQLLCGLLPVTVLTFDRVAYAAPVANMLALPLFSVVTVPLALGGFALDGLFGPVGDRSLQLAAASIGWLEAWVTAIASLPVAAPTVPAIAGMAWLLLFLPALWALLPPGWPGRAAAWLGLAALALYQPGRPVQGCAEAYVLDVGQGLAVVVETRRHTLVFDTGAAYRNGGSVAESVLLPFLASRGTRRLDRLFVSHADLDHAGGVDPLHAGIAVAEVYAGEPLGQSALWPRFCRRGQRWRWDGVWFTVLHPARDAGFSGNDASCVLLVEAGPRRLLLTGDIEAKGEAALIAAGGLTSVDVVVMPHHGSTTSSSPAFVAATRPAVAIASAGHGNRWRQPRQEVVERWRRVGSAVLTTSVSGAVRLRLCDGAESVAVNEHRRNRRRIWHE